MLTVVEFLLQRQLIARRVVCRCHFPCQLSPPVTSVTVTSLGHSHLSCHVPNHLRPNCGVSRPARSTRLPSQLISRCQRSQPQLTTDVKLPDTSPREFDNSSLRSDASSSDYSFRLPALSFPSTFTFSAESESESESESEPERDSDRHRHRLRNTRCLLLPPPSSADCGGGGAVDSGARLSRGRRDAPPAAPARRHRTPQDGRNKGRPAGDEGSRCGMVIGHLPLLPL